jgi:hypothetical protein
MQAGWIEVCETPIADLMRERDEAREALRDLREECKKEGWLLHASKAPVMDRARAILGRAGGE